VSLGRDPSLRANILRAALGDSAPDVKHSNKKCFTANYILHAILIKGSKLVGHKILQELLCERLNICIQLPVLYCKICNVTEAGNQLLL